MAGGERVEVEVNLLGHAEIVAALDRAQAENLRLKQAVDGVEERLGSALRRIEYLEATNRLLRQAFGR